MINIRSRNLLFELPLMAFDGMVPVVVFLVGM